MFTQRLLPQAAYLHLHYVLVAATVMPDLGGIVEVDDVVFCLANKAPVVQLVRGAAGTALLYRPCISSDACKERTHRTMDISIGQVLSSGSY